jgi:hypothetical protein
VLTSTNGSDWVSHSVDHGTSAVTYGAGCFVTVETKGDANLPQDVYVYRSTNGIDWMQIPTPATNRLQTIRYAGGLFVAAGVKGLVMTSPDGVTWTLRYSAISNRTWYEVAYGNGAFVISGLSAPSDGKVLTSTNGVEWGLISATPPHNCRVAFGNGEFVALTGTEYSDGRTLVGYSANGVDWQTNMAAELAYWSEIRFVNDRFVVPGSPPIMSFDGRDWELMGRPLDLKAERIKYLNDAFLAFGAGTNFGASSNGSDWTLQPVSLQGLQLKDALFVNGRYILVGSQSNNAVTVTSTNLSDWSASSFSNSSAFSDVTFAAGIFLATSHNPWAFQAIDALVAKHKSPAAVPK